MRTFSKVLSINSAFAGEGVEHNTQTFLEGSELAREGC
jgi:hypothetical protein